MAGSKPGKRNKSGKLTAEITVNGSGTAPAVASPRAVSAGKKAKPVEVVRVRGSYDMVLLLLTIVLSLMGIVTVFSASYAYSYTFYGNSYQYIKNHVIYVLVGYAALFVLMHISYNLIKRFTVLAYVFSLGLLMVVLLYGGVLGVARRWITVFGVSVQPSEFAKLTVVLMLALYISRNQNRIVNYSNFGMSTLYGIIVPAIILALPCILILLENHFSGTLIVFAIGAVIIFASGARPGWMAAAAGTAFVIILVLILSSSYARTRVDMLFNPENYDPKGEIWQTLQGLNAIGSGGLFGVGIGNSKQKYLFVSQPQNDFIFSILCEETGFAGALLVIILFILLIWRGFRIAMRAPDTYSSLVALGITSKIAVQTILNIAVVTNTVPNTGVSLPFFSCGGTAVFMQLAEIGILLSISRYTYVDNIPEESAA